MNLKNLFRSDKEPLFGGQEHDHSHDDSDECCGAHEVCERDLRRAQPIVYYDDEELDQFRYRASDSYSDEELDQFREVLETMWESDVAGWVRSLQAREIELPDTLKDEVIMLLNS